MAEYATYAEARQAAATAQQLRDLAREVAAEARSNKVCLMLRLDGEFVEIVEHEGTMRSPNNDYRTIDVPSVASDEHLFYPDVVRWETQEHIDTAPARRMIDKFRIPEALNKPLGGTIRQKLEAIRIDQHPPEQLRAPPQRPAQNSSGAAPRMHRARQGASVWAWVGFNLIWIGVLILLGRHGADVAARTHNANQSVSIGMTVVGAFAVGGAMADVYLDSGKGSRVGPFIGSVLVRALLGTACFGLTIGLSCSGRC